MPNSGLAEIYFIAALMILTLIISGVAVFFFVRTFQREKRAKEAAQKQKTRQKTETETQN